jgi:hypothetical protein
MKPPADLPHVPPAAGSASPANDAASPIAHRRLLRGWLRALAWLGLGCIGAANPGASAQHCAPGCVKKHVDRKRRLRPLKPRSVQPPSMRPKSAAGSLARRSGAAEEAHARQRTRGSMAGGR